MSERETEYWDIYDKDKKLTGRLMKRNEWTLKDDEYHLSVLGVVKRPDGKFLITRRLLNKHWAPGWWEVSGGGAKAGETSLEAVRREVHEETGLDITDAKFTYAFDYHRENPGEGDNYFVDIYLVELDFTEADVHIQEDEVLDYRLATAEEIKAIADEGIFLHYDSIRRIFSM